MSGGAVLGIVAPGLPHPLLVPEQNEGWGRIRSAFAAARREIEKVDPDLLLIYSTMWPSVIGHQIQADPAPKWVHVDELFHELGSIPYEFKMDAAFSEAYRTAAQTRGLHARTVAYHGFPIDTGSVVALKLLDADNAWPASIVSSNVYCDRAETVVFGKAARDALETQGKRAVVIAVTTLSNRLFTDFIAPEDDHIHSQKDDEWNRKLLEFLGDGRLEDVAQLSRDIQRHVRVKKVVNFKSMWWLGAVLGQHNNYTGCVHDYAPLYGAGAAVVTLKPAAAGVGDKEYDEAEVEQFTGDRQVVARESGGGSVARESGGGSVARESGGGSVARESGGGSVARSSGEASAAAAIVETDTAPTPVGAYPHARREGDLIYLSGIGPRRPGSGAIPGGPIRDEQGQPADYDVAAQTRSVIENVQSVLAAAGATLADVIDVTVFLVDMDRDFATFNGIYAEHFAGVRATRTTVAVRALPTPIAVEFKIVARAPQS